MKNTLMLMLVSMAIGFSASTSAATPQEKSSYTAANEKAAADYKAASDQCKQLTGNPKDVCVAEAKARRVQTEAEATAQYKGTASARASARKDIAEANYKVAKAKCDSQNGNAKDVCIKEAKAALAAAKADATADEKVSDARSDARDDKQAAAYKVAIEKCDAFAGSSKDACIADAKARYGK